MIPLLAGLVIKKVNSRGAIAGVAAGTISGVTLIILNGILLSIYRERLASDPTLSYWLKQGWNSASIGINILSTILGLWIGTAASKTPDDEKLRAQEFIKRMSIPSEPKIDAERKVESPFSLVGLSLIIYGLIYFVLIVLMAVKGSPQRLAVNVTAAGLTFLSGVLFRIFSKRKKSQAS
jgi:MFS family permease